MEKMRQKIDSKGGYFDLQQLGPPRAGVICEDLGRTTYKIGRNKIVKTPFVGPEDDSSDDSIDAFSSKNQSSSWMTPHGRQALKKGSLPKGMNATIASGLNVKPRPTFKATKVAYAEENNSPPPVLRPKACATFRGAKKRTLFDDNDEIPPLHQPALNTKRSRKLSSHRDDHSSFPLEELSPNSAKRSKGAREHKLEPAPFPMLDEFHAASFKKSTSIPRPAPFPKAVPSPKYLSRKSKPAPFPMQSQISCARTVVRTPRQFPLDSPFASSDKNNSDDDNDELNITDKDNGIILTHGGPRPFPMSMSQFPPKPRPAASDSKRSVYDEVDRRTSRKSRPSFESDGFGSLSLDGDGNLDPSTICPYCDEPWPSAPSPTLTALLEHTKRRSYSDPRPGNALGLKAPLTAFVELCQRHRFEMTHLPLALARGWPTRLDFASLPKRIEAFRQKLGRFVARPHESQFWRAIRDDVKKVGRMKVVSVSGQYATFERTQPGYYGEQGSIIIHQSLYSLCPPDSIPSASVLPLTADQFLTCVLVPETAALLIQQDMDLPTKEEALRVLDESKRYGLAMFPEQAQTKEVAEVGEALARERARAQRRLLEERGEADADVKREVQREQRQARRAKAMEKDKAHAKAKAKVNALDTASELDQETGEVWKGRTAEEPCQVPFAKKLTKKAKHQRWDENGDLLTLNESEESISRPAKVADKPRELSTTSWRSNHSPSTSRFRQFTWVSDMSDVSASSDREDIDIYEMIVEKQDDTAQTLSSDLNAVVVTGEPTPTPKPKPKPRRIVKGSTHSEESASDADLMNEATIKRTTRKPKQITGKGHSVHGEGDEKMKRALGQTKRRKKKNGGERNDVRRGDYAKSYSQIDADDESM